MAQRKFGITHKYLPILILVPTIFTFLPGVITITFYKQQDFPILSLRGGGPLAGARRSNLGVFINKRDCFADARNDRDPHFFAEVLKQIIWKDPGC